MSGCNGLTAKVKNTRFMKNVTWENLFFPFTNVKLSISNWFLNLKKKFQEFCIIARKISKSLQSFAVCPTMIRSKNSDLFNTLQLHGGKKSVWRLNIKHFSFSILWRSEKSYLISVKIRNLFPKDQIRNYLIEAD